MIVSDMYFSIAVAVLLSVVFALLIRRRKAGQGFFWFFLTVFLASWAGGTWGNLLSPAFRGTPWVSHLFAGLLAVSLLMIFLPEEPKVGSESQLNREETRELLERAGISRELEKLAYIGIDILLACILLLLIVAITLRYFGHA